MALVVPPPNDKKRVKVYELKNNDWFDRGTGFCTGRVVNVSASRWFEKGPDTALPGETHGYGYGLRTANTGAFQEESKIYVESEDLPERLLLETKITKDDGYQKQQGNEAVYRLLVLRIWLTTT